MSTASVVRISAAMAPDEGLGPDSRPVWGSPVEITAAVLRGRWTAVVVWHLFWGDKRFYQLLRETRGIHRRALAHELRAKLLAYERRDTAADAARAPAVRLYQQWGATAKVAALGRVEGE